MATEENSQPAMNEPVGRQLQKAREKSGLSAADVAAAQHLRPSVIQAIESGDYSQIDSELFLKGYVRAYAKQVGLDADAVIADLDQELEPMRQQREQEKEANPLVDIERRRRRKRQLAKALFLLVVLAIAGELLTKAKQDNKGVAVAIADIDLFKQYNDHYGHFAGDECLIQVAQAFLSMKRHPLDSCIRFGGEEFILIKYDVTLEQSASWGQKIIDTIYALNIPHLAANEEQRITVSAGLIHWHPTSSLTRTQLMKLADEALYKAKANGRNQVQMHLSKTK